MANGPKANMSNLKPDIIRESALSIADKMAQQNEGLTYKPYHDTVGKLTVGYGRNLEDRGITFEEAKLMLAHDIVEAHTELWTQFGFFRDLSDVRKAVLMDMYHNMGISRLLGFEKMIEAIRVKDFDRAATEMKDSRYWKQVGRRAKRNYCMMRFDRWFDTENAESYFINQ